VTPTDGHGPQERERAGAIEPARAPLLALHRVLIDLERGEYEKRHGRVTPATLLDLLLHHPQFEWLRPLSVAIAAMDQMPATPDTLAMRIAWVETMRELLSPDPELGGFQRHYAARLARSPEALHAHAMVVKVLPRTSTTR